jgi:Chromo (CHRromatin Organisation MOdifier) domain
LLSERESNQPAHSRASLYVSRVRPDASFANRYHRPLSCGRTRHAIRDSDHRLLHAICRVLPYGFARYIMSDNGSQFVNETCTCLLRLLGTEKRVTSPYSHEQNAIVERVNREFGRHLRALLFDQKVVEIWSFKFLPIIQRVYNNSVHSSTGVSPAQMLFGNSMDLDRGILYPHTELSELPSRSVSDYLDRFLVAQAVILRAAVKHQLALDEYHVKVRSQPNLVLPRKRKAAALDSSDITVFPVNSYVLYRNMSRTSKFAHPWRGPFLVREIRPDGDYLLEEILSGKAVRAHVQHLKAFLYNIADTGAPALAAARNAGEWRIDSILAHRGDSKKRKTLEFLVHWSGYPPEYDTWEPWKALRPTLPLANYLLADPALRYLVPRQHR